MPAHARPLTVTTIGLISLSVLIGCAASSAQRASTISARNDAPIPVIRQGRYTLVELTPTMAQHDLLQQIIEISIPPTMDATVGDALRYVLTRSGYRLCDTPDVTDALYALPLPAAHLQLGPIRLREALQLLAGPAWELSVDDTDRTICFHRRAMSASENTRFYDEPTVWL